MKKDDNIEKGFETYKKNMKKINETYEKNMKKHHETFKKNISDLWMGFKHGTLYPALYIFIILFFYHIINLTSAYFIVIALNLIVIHSIASFPFEYKLYHKIKILIYKHLFIILFSILTYSLIYFKIWDFIINWEIQKISFLESLYFSISMWVDLWYSYILPKKEIALISSIEAINWYFYFAFILAILSIWIHDTINKLK